jgi:hypothetical protein
MLFSDLEQCKQCLCQININKGLDENRTWGTVQEITNASHEDYKNGYMAVIPKPTFINNLSKWLDKCDKYEYIEKEFDVSWFDKPKLKLKKELKVEDLKE